MRVAGKSWLLTLALLSSMELAAAAALEGSNWQLTQVVQADWLMHSVPPAVEATATFAAGKLSGSGGCNRYTATYVLRGQQLTIGNAATTMMACPEAQAKVEQGFMAALALTASYRIQDRMLLLLDQQGHKLAVFQVQQAAALTGTTWQATAYNNGREAVVSLLDGSSISAVFNADGSLSGSAGCNQYHAQYQAAHGTISIQPPASTRKLCTQPEGVMQQEAEYLQALGKAATYSIQGQQLELRSSSAALIAMFRAGG